MGGNPDVIYAVVDVNAASNLPPAWSREFNENVTIFEYSEFAPEELSPGSVVVFIGTSLFGPERKSLAIGLENRLHPDVKVLNRPSSTNPRHEAIASRKTWRGSELREATFPVSLRADHPAGNIDTPPILGAPELREVLAEMILASYRIEDLVAVEITDLDDVGHLKVFAVNGELLNCPPRFTEQVTTLFANAGVDVGLLELAVQSEAISPWRLDDGPDALFPPMAIAGQWLKALART